MCTAINHQWDKGWIQNLLNCNTMSPCTQESQLPSTNSKIEGNCDASMLVLFVWHFSDYVNHLYTVLKCTFKLYYIFFYSGFYATVSQLRRFKRYYCGCSAGCLYFNVLNFQILYYTLFPKSNFFVP